MRTRKEFSDLRVRSPQSAVLSAVRVFHLAQNNGRAKETFAPLWRPRSETRHALVNAVTLEALA